MKQKTKHTTFIGKKNSRIEERFFYWMLPSVLLPLIRSGHIKKGDENDISRVVQILKRKKKLATGKMKWSVAVEQTFEQEAIEAWKKGNKDVAIVLLATALEQCLNANLRIIIEAKGYQTDHATNLIRLLNIESKMTWCFEMFSGKTFPKKMLKRIKTISEIRNMIVHYKAVSAHPDTLEGSHAKIEQQLEALGHFRVGVFFQKFYTFCEEVGHRCDPAIPLALELREKIMPYKKAYQ